MKCDKCGDPNCVDYRAAFKREPWLPGGFELGAQWYSYDAGLTWTRFPAVEQVKEMQGRRGHIGSMTVTAINRDRGEITIKVG